MTDAPARDWNPGTYQRFRGLRLRPALDLLAAVPDLPEGPVVDLGCGTGVMAEALKARFPGRVLVGVDSSPSMLGEARTGGAYDALEQTDIVAWSPDFPPALIFSNAALHWLPDHAVLLPSLAGKLAPGGTLAIQVPRQWLEPSHALLRHFSAEMFPDRFNWDGYRPPVGTPESYIHMLEPLGDVTAWETTYFQRLSRESEGHPVRMFTQSTAARPMLDLLTDTEAADFLSAYDGALAWAYPARPGGEVIFPFKRLFLTVTLPA